MKIVVLLGGDSPERDVSLNSGKNIAHALRENGHDVIEFDPGLSSKELVKSLHSLIKDVNKLNTIATHPGFFSNFFLLNFFDFDLVFNGLHGGKGENGVVQTLLETLNIPFTGSSSVACMLSMDKEITKHLLVQADLPTAQALYIKNKNAPIPPIEGLKYPVIVKPADGGSSLGHTVLNSKDDVEAAVEYAFRYGYKVMIEEYIKGKEIAAGVLSGKALPLVHIKPKHSIYDYECKYTDGMSSYDVPANIDTGLTEQIQHYAVRVYELFQCSGYARIDFLLKENGDAVILEANTLPGMTSTSLLPKAAKAAGWDFNKLIEKIVQEAVKTL